MTRPIYEPSLTRTDAELGYGRDQLFRRPAPTDTGLLPGFRARRELGSLTIPSGSDAVVCWDNWEMCDPDVFEEGALGTGSCANQLVGVKLLATGVYAIHAQLDYEETLNFKSAIGVWDLITEKMWHDLPDWMDISTAAPSLHTQIVRAYHAAETAEIRISTMHLAGVNKTIGSDDTLTSNFFQIYYLGPYDCTDCPDDALWPYIGGGFSCGPSS